MKTIILVVIVGCLAVGCGQTDRFSLVDRNTKQEFGPFAFRDGATVRVNNRDYALRKLPSRGQVLETRLRDRIIPSVEFREADVRDVVQFLNEIQVQDMDAMWANPLIKINVDLPPGKADTIPKVTMHARMLSEYDALRVIAEMTGLSLVIDNGSIWLRYRK